MKRFPILFAIALSGCASKPVLLENAVPVPASRILSSELFTGAPGTGLVNVRRDTGMMNSGCALRLFVDAKPAADINTAEKVSIYLTDGSHVLSISLAAPCSGNVLAEVAAVATPKNPVSFRIAYSAAGEFSISPTAF